MTVTAFPPTSTDQTLLNLSRLFGRLEHNLLAPGADLKALKRDEYTRRRVGANVDYARTQLLTLERSLPSKSNRRELQTEVARKREMLKLLQDVLDRIANEDSALEEDEEEGENLLEGVEEEIFTPEGSSNDDGEHTPFETAAAAATEPSYTHTALPATTTTTTEPTLRNRHTQPTPISTSDQPTATTTATSHHPSSSQHQKTEQSLTTHRLEQESLTTSLLSLASQLKASSQSFQSSLDAEKSVLSRAVDGIDKTTSNMEAAGKRMGLLRKMTEGKGWWGRMMLYAWIFGLWILAVLIVFLGPKLRF